MALIELTLFSPVLITDMEVNVILPESLNRWASPDGDLTGRCPTLYLLHGMSDDHSIWLRRTSIERYAEEYGIAIVMPTTYLGFYTDMHMGEKYWQFIAKELPSALRALFPQMSSRREDTFVAGLSMGGYGALKCGFREYDTFSRAAGLSSVCDVAGLVQKPTFASPAYWQDVFGPADQVAGSFNDLMAAAAEMADGNLPRVEFFMWCGTEDFLYSQNVKLRDHMKQLGLPLTYEESPGSHAWKYWDEKIQTVLKWLPLGKEEN